MSAVVAFGKFLAGLHFTGKQAPLQRAISQYGLVMLYTVWHCFIFHCAVNHAKGYLVTYQLYPLFCFLQLICIVIANTCITYFALLYQCFYRLHSFVYGRGNIGPMNMV